MYVILHAYAAGVQWCMVNPEYDDILCMEETTVTARSYRHRTTIPAKIFRMLRLTQGDKLRWLVLRDGSILLSKIEPELPPDTDKDPAGSTKKIQNE